YVYCMICHAKYDSVDPIQLTDEP
ncbi:hypothetical protein A2U01_0095559, partial [Trifolium medium]|nr:hypothetical protein [Trifolium medium]